MTEPLGDRMATWLTEAVADARRRGLPDLEPLLESLARATEAIRKADWNDEAAALGGAAVRSSPDRP